MIWKGGQARAILHIPLPFELIVLIQTFIDNWCGATYEDVYHVLRFWKDGYKLAAQRVKKCLEPNTGVGL